MDLLLAGTIKIIAKKLDFKKLTDCLVKVGLTFFDLAYLLQGKMCLKVCIVQEGDQTSVHSFFSKSKDFQFCCS